MDLHNDRNVYILGAGFSFDRGLPLVGNFMHVLRDAHPWLIKENRKQEADAVRDVLNHRLSSASASYHVQVDLENIEQLFSLASMAKGKLMDSVRLAIAATLDYAQQARPEPRVRFECEKSIPVPSSFITTQAGSPDWKVHLAPSYDVYAACMLGRFLGVPISLESSTIITFNYDLLVEEALAHLKIPYSYGFRGRSVSNDKSFTGGSGTAQSIQILKLHGSLNWARRVGKGRTFTVYGNYADVRANALVPELIPPTWDKHVEKQVRDVWEAAINAISKATRLIIIGFSMPETDVHFKYLLAAGLSQNISLRKILFVDPAAGAVKQRAERLFREVSRIEFLPLTTEAFFRQFRANGEAIGRASQKLMSDIMRA